MPPAPMYGRNAGGGIFAGGLGGAGMGQIEKIEKIYNCVIYEKFITEFKRMLKKYP